jgi:16S rRNA (guanine966-N2)-methyltransferase
LRVRVIAGRLGGRVLKAPPGDATRPTSAKVKEALFSILGELTGLRVLDLYAGSGALGIEAISRGASSAVFVEAARPALGCLRHNLEQLGLESVTSVVSGRVEASIKRLVGAFDLVLCDPPWRDVRSALTQLAALAEAGLLSSAARLVLEHAAKDRIEPLPMLGVYDQRHWGDTAVSLFKIEGKRG